MAPHSMIVIRQGPGSQILKPLAPTGKIGPQILMTVSTDLDHPYILDHLGASCTHIPTERQWCNGPAAQVVFMMFSKPSESSS